MTDECKNDLLTSKREFMLFCLASVDPQLALTLTWTHLISTDIEVFHASTVCSSMMQLGSSSTKNKNKTKLTSGIFLLKCHIWFSPSRLFSFSSHCLCLPRCLFFICFFSWHPLACRHITHISSTTSLYPWTSHKCDPSFEESCHVMFQGLDCNPRRNM